jgi:hypothetical protein
MVVGIAGFWAVSALAAQLPPALRFVVTIAALACGFVFFYTASQVAAEGTGYGPLDFWHGVPGQSRVPAKAGSGWGSSCSGRRGGRPSWPPPVGHERSCGWCSPSPSSQRSLRSP